ncbi:adenylate/guanylate cyclase domain-containing protein [Chitinibacter sp. SCUT-21]|uniref:adenylate/guanylate cyclase domain-containing protein n=1 Tax=Chitinibacter sp. SCUT-21 TaxID=2970891 RepID=UPI0035A5A1A4
MFDAEVETRFQSLAQSTSPAFTRALRQLILEGSDRDLNRVNVLTFAARYGVNEEDAITGFIYAVRAGLFDLSWNLLCPGCGGVLGANASLKSLHRDEYQCVICSVGYTPTLDEIVEASFSVNRRVRHIAGHEPESLPFWEYLRQFFWSSGLIMPEGEEFDQLASEIALDTVELSPGEKCQISLQLKPNHLLVFEPVTHTALHLNVRGEPPEQRQDLSIVYTCDELQLPPRKLRPGPVRLTLENRTQQRLLPGIYIGGPSFKKMIAQRRPYLTAARLLTNQAFRDIYRGDTLDVDQRLKLTSLSFLFTDLKGSTELYERVGDLQAFDLVRAHFSVLTDAVNAAHGAVVKTIGDAVMATFAAPERAVAAALQMRAAMRELNAARGREDLLVKIGIHEGSCLAVSLNDRLDYFGQTVNIAARVQGLADSQSIYVTEPVMQQAAVVQLLQEQQLIPQARRLPLRGLSDHFTVYEIP